jgi:hypothetical protein
MVANGDRREVALILLLGITFLDNAVGLETLERFDGDELELGLDKSENEIDEREIPGPWDMGFFFFCLGVTSFNRCVHSSPQPFCLRFVAMGSKGVRGRS